MSEPATPAYLAALVDEATRRSGVVWLAPAGAPPGSGGAAWLLWHGGAGYVLHGGAEQPAPALVGAARVAVTVPSKDRGGRLVTWLADAAPVLPGSAEWAEVVPLLLARRLNLADAPAAAARWAAQSAITRLAPTGEANAG